MIMVSHLYSVHLKGQYIEWTRHRIVKIQKKNGNCLWSGKDYELASKFFR